MVVFTGDITQLLAQARGGEPERLSAVFDALYPELKRIAGAKLHGRECTITPTALVHESYLRIASGQPLRAEDRRHFFAVAARCMRSVLVDHARSRQAGKRGGGRIAVTLSGQAAAEEETIDWLALESALKALEKISARRREIVELHYFAGLDWADVAALLGCSERTVYNEWHRARAFLHARLDSP